VDFKSLKQRLGVAKEDAEEAGKEAQKIYNAFQILQEQQKRISIEFKRIQIRLTVDVESTATENDRLQQNVRRLTAKAMKIREERDGTIRRALQFQEVLGPLKLELKVTHKDVRRARAFNREKRCTSLRPTYRGSSTNSERRQRSR
jgi:hypothetical protein